MNYNKNTLLWIKEHAPRVEGSGNDWELVYECIRENLAGKDDIYPGTIYHFLVNKVGYPDVMPDGWDTLIKPDAPCPDPDWNPENLMDYMSMCIQLDLDVAKYMPRVIGHTEPAVDPDGLLMFAFTYMNDGYTQYRPDVFNRMRKNLGV